MSTIAALLFASASLISQSTGNGLRLLDQNKKFSVSVYGTFISSSELQNNAKAFDSFERNATVPLGGGYGYGTELNYKPELLDLNLTFYLSSEYFKLTQRDMYLHLEQGSNSANIAMTESFHVIPVELGLKWDLPVSTDRFKIYIGGGGGMYFGDRIRTLGTSLVSTTTYKKPGFSLNILTGLEYFLERNFSADFEFKFREGSFDVESIFDRNFVTVNGNNFDLGNPIYSKIILDGVRISLGLRYSF